MIVDIEKTSLNDIEISNIEGQTKKEDAQKQYTPG